MRSKGSRCRQGRRATWRACAAVKGSSSNASAVRRFSKSGGIRSFPKLYFSQISHRVTALTNTPFAGSAMRARACGDRQGSPRNHQRSKCVSKRNFTPLALAFRRLPPCRPAKYRNPERSRFHLSWRPASGGHRDADKEPASPRASPLSPAQPRRLSAQVQSTQTAPPLPERCCAPP